MIKNVSKITINAQAKKVWEALVLPEFVKQWQYGSLLITDWKIGNEIRFRSEWNGQIFEQWGKVLEFNPCQSLSYTLFAPRPDLEDKPENYFIMKYILTENSNSTMLEIIQEDGRPGAVQEQPQGEENQVLATLKKCVEDNK